MKVVLILDSLRSVENVGSIFRTAECLGVEEIVLCGTTPAPTDRFGRARKDLAKVSLGAEHLVPWVYAESVDDAVNLLRTRKYKIVALEQDPRAVSLDKFEKSENIALVIGNEVEGVAKSILDTADEIIEIKMMGKKESLNVSVATGIALYELLK